jgi:hypothetical protein
MKRPDPNEDRRAAVHSPCDLTTFATVGRAPEQQPALLWARQLGLIQPLDLVLRALRSDRYLGTALNYLHQEIPRALIQRWAPEVDFFQDLLVLADAFATSPAMQNHYRYLRLDTPILPQMDEGGMAKHPFASVVARRISTKRPENDTWLETLRGWWALQFLEAETRNTELGKRRTNIGQAIRLCIQDTTGFGPWTPVMMELRGPSDSYRELHRHLVSQADKTYRKADLAASHKSFLRDLAHIDDSDKPDDEVLSRDKTVSRHTLNPNWIPPTNSETYQTRHLHAHWLEDLGITSENDSARSDPPLSEDTGWPDSLSELPAEQCPCSSEVREHVRAFLQAAAPPPP